ncbi:hypothetical protein Mapa_003286 [Marchantia paleacea]|nr:hypothetical protein Mapa_003286 [Marchantia paleacea]
MCHNDKCGFLPTIWIHELLECVPKRVHVCLCGFERYDRSVTHTKRMGTTIKPHGVEVDKESNTAQSSDRAIESLRKNPNTSYE